MPRHRPVPTKNEFTERSKQEKVERREELDREVRNQHGPVRVIMQGGIRKLETIPVDLDRPKPMK